MGDRPGRPRTKPDGQRVTVYISKEVLSKLDKHTSSKVSRSTLIENIINFVLKGNEQFIMKVKEVEELKLKVRELEHKNSELMRERDSLARRVEKLEAQLSKLKEKKQSALTKWERRTQEQMVLVEKIKREIREGMTWKEVMVQIGILDRSAQIDVLHQFFRKESYFFVSEYIPGWKLIPNKNSSEGYFGYIFRRENGHKVRIKKKKVST